MKLSKGQKKKLRSKNKKIEELTKDDQILRNIFTANLYENLNSYPVNKKDIPEFNPHLILKIDDTLLKSM